ncbi:alpha/beta hydrolase [Mycobacterium sp. 663a-19]|uniref:putative alpha/beta hydrolase n=1 Tax=Mycobacterium sp. 663a-19 TaxID=2986148 RepID=UPI002D1E836D|nr:alpha/beta hydrolase [Mycobacterium sp. 663a-19]MEB3982587.1 alpha/beta hydrolase [Mycobacterium sp. 663a-19]
MRLRYISIEALIAEAGGDPWAIDRSLQAGRPARIADLAQAFHAAGRCTAESSSAFDEARRRFEASWNRDDGENPINDSAEVQRVAASLGAQSLQLPKIGVDLENIAAALAEAQHTGAVLTSALEGRLQQLDDELGQAVEQEKDARLTAGDRAALDALISQLEQEAIDDTKSALGQLVSLRDGYSDYLQRATATLRVDGYDAAPVQGLDAEESPPKPQGPVQVPPPDTKPEEVKKWWDSLSQEQKDRLVAQHPPELGNLNGINAIVRDTVNQAVMNDDIDRVENIARQRGVSAADVLANPGMYGLSATDVTRYGNAVKTRDSLDYDRGPEGPNQRPVMLWAYDPLAFNGWGKAAIAIGNPDYARNTAVIVPGTGSSVAQGWMSGHQDAVNLYDQSLAADPEHHYTSVIAWMGYEAPHGFSDLRVSEPGLARAGGDLLAADVNGLWVTHNSLTPQHVTVIGHSYGSTTVADAFAHGNMHANDAVLIGCPGTDLARSAADFHLDGGHVYVGAASTDPVSWIGEGSGMPEQWLKNKVREYGLPIPFDAGLGRDPAGDGYGSIRFHAEVAGSDEMDRYDHSHYYDMGSEALRSMTDIASGHSERLATDDLLADGRRQPHVGPFRIPGLPAYIDPEHDRPRDTIHDNHAYRAYAPR